jgi:multicomponent K+:H+ antiporter subunit A
VLYFGLHRFLDLHRVVRLPLWVGLGGRDVFLALGHAAVDAARAATGALQNGRLQRYLFVLVALAGAAGAWPFLRGGPSPQMAAPHLRGLDFGIAAVWCIGIAATLGVVRVHRQRLLALLLLGAVGVAVCLVFVFFSAPDLALTQLLVEVATITLMMLALHWLPATSPHVQSRWRAGRDALLAGAAGAGVAAIVWMVLTRPFDSMSPYFLVHALPDGGGANVVNVILVDFRGFDTLGEVTVLALAALIIHALMSGFAPRNVMRPGSEAQRHPLMLQITARLILPFAVLTSIYLFLRGHNQPGGGFIAGLVLAIALVLQYVANGQDWVAARLPTDDRPLVAWGLLIAAASGMASWAFDAPLLTSSYDYPLWPLVGAMPLASAAAFDFGVALVVIGATLTALGSMARLSASSR